MPRHAIIKLRVEGWNPCRTHRVAARRAVRKGKPVEVCRKGECKTGGPVLVGVREGPSNLFVQGFAFFVQANILKTTAGTLNDITGFGFSISPTVAVSTLGLVAGTSNFPVAAVTDFKLGSPIAGASGSATPTVGSYSGSGSSGSFNVTGTFSNTSGGSITYAEVGITVFISSLSATFLMTHDSFSGLNISNGGTLSVTYTLTFS